ncbi:MAG TPA: diguanylate cyclase, partial [Candidatus Saccharimonadales bacterium]|nr:diguanylate cyclase [Candidatus Saccharimonadales bacterium]
TEFLDLLRLSSIRRKIIAFSLVATLLPAITMGWVSYRNNLKVLEEKIRQELTSLASHSSRELVLWLDGKKDDVRVFASSYEVSENLEKITASGDDSAGSRYVSRLRDYLKSVEHRFPDYAELAVLDLEGHVVATSSDRQSSHEMPEGWQSLAQEGKVILGDPYRDDVLGTGVLLVAEPVRVAGDRCLGVLAAKLKLAPIGETLHRQVPSGSARLYVITKNGTILSSDPPLDGPPLSAGLPRDTATDLFTGSVVPLEFAGLRGTEVVGALDPISGTPWGTVAEKSRDLEYAEISSLRNVTLVLVGTILLGVGLAAWLLGLTLVRPLGRLIAAAGKVTGGDMSVELPIYGRGEVGYLTVVFNRMVARLRKAHEELDATNKALVRKNEELQHLSITDDLTGLHNRKHMNETVDNEFRRAERHGHVLSILMIDIDRFKNFNDARGHQAGDEVIRGVARVLNDTIRTTDYAARYGGEEFLVLLPYIGPDEAVKTAERIREAVERASLGAAGDVPGLTISVGVASYPDCGNDAEAVIREADLALYKAKRAGRNQV